MTSTLRTALFVSLAALSGCDGCDEPRVVGATANPGACETCLRSRRDNPVVTGVLPLQPARFADDALRERAERNVYGFVYSNCRVDSHASGNDARGATGQSLTPMPSTLGITEADQRVPTASLGWELHGTELGYAMSTIATSRTNRTGTSVVPSKGDPVRVDLDPSVMLVPVQIVRIVPAGAGMPHATDLSPYTTAVQKKYWDDRPDLATTRRSDPGAPNVRAEHAMNSKSLPWTSADEIWSQCGIQFRMVTCPGHPEGCPDLPVSDNTRIVETRCSSERIATPAVYANWDEAAALPGVRRDLPLITFTWAVEGAGCPTGAVTDPGRPRVAMGFAPMFGLGGGGDLDLAHELGHVLGLEDFEGCPPGAGHLMCHDGTGDRRIRPEDCRKARARAAAFVKRHWGVDVAQ